MADSSRISNLKRLLHETTTEAYASIVTTNATLIGDCLPTDHDVTDELHSRDKAGHEVGLSLFGTSHEYRQQVQDEFNEKLHQIEREVASIRDDIASTHNVSDDGTSDETDMLNSLNPEQLQRHVQFLQLCSSASKALDRIDSLQFASDNASAAMSFSPSSMLLSPLSDSINSGRFNFETFNGDGSGSNSSASLSAAQILVEVDGDIDAALRVLQGNNDDNRDGGDQALELYRMQSSMIDELQNQMRRKKVELRHRAISILEGCVCVENNKLCVRGSNNGSTKKLVNFDLDADSNTPREVNSMNSLLEDAYAVLETFSNDKYPVFGETLDRAIKTIGKQLLSQVFEPTIKELGTSNDDDTAITVRYYTFTQETIKNSTVSRKYDPVLIKGQAVQLMWESKTMNYTSTFLDGNDNTISVASEINANDLLASSPSATVATFLSCLNFVTQVLDFVQKHVLLQRTDLAKQLGMYLFGSYPISTSLLSGSAKLGGVLVGFAAQAEESGEIRPLMTELVKCLRKWCIPNDSNLEIWRTIQKVQDVLIKEVSMFEDKLIKMGYMNANDEIHEFAGASPPSKLMVKQEHGIGSPIHANVTVNHDDIPEICSPPTIQNKISNTGRSSLSEITNTFLQAYSESQRSQILNRGRFILVNTDYHNSVQVGKFVPPLSEPGTVEHLDEDPVNAFVFQQCTVSITARKTLDLVRQTLDEAICPDLARELDALPPMLYRASREVLDLFRALIPTLYASEIGNIPRMAAIFHNDCVFLAHEASLLGAEYKVKFKSNEVISQSKMHLLSEVFTFVDMVPLFRELANKTMGSMLDVQKKQLFEMLSPHLASFQEALSSNESVTEWDDAETALRTALYHLRHLSQSWTHVLSRDVYHLAIGNLVDTVFTLLMEPIMTAETVTDAASRFVHSLFLDAARGCSEVFLIGKSTNITPPKNPEETAQHAKVAAKNSLLFDKFQCIGQFMIMRLDDITRGLEDGLVFQSITGKELSHLIIATYDESAKRNTLLKALASKS